MAVKKSTLGYVLLHIYEFPSEGGIYLPVVDRYEVGTPCLVTWADSGDEAIIHQTCIDEGFRNWFNVAVVSDTCDEAAEQTEASLIAAFNEDCEEGGWLSRMMNYRA